MIAFVWIISYNYTSIKNRKMVFDHKSSDLFKEYNDFLSSSFTKDYWTNGAYTNERINWKDAKRAKSLDSFNSTGIYIWGCDERPIYIGKAEGQSLAKRFSRYIWQKKSQLNIATLYSEYLSSSGKRKTKYEIAVDYDISLSRAKGAKQFGEAGADKVWFIHIPLEVSVINQLEDRLIAIGDKWNLMHELPELINTIKVEKTRKRKLKSTVIFSHGKESGPNGRKINMMRTVAENLGYKTISIDYSNIDDVTSRVSLLEETIDFQRKNDIVLVGSSMGGYVSTVVSNSTNITGLFLLAPALFMKDYPIQNYKPLASKVEIVHGWSDDIIPFENSVRFAKSNNYSLHLLDDDHRLGGSLPKIAKLFKAFLRS